jgi:hypothetical protein
LAKIKTEKALPKLTDAERHKRFVDMAKEVGASEKPEDFDSAFKNVTKPPKQP